MKSGCTLTKNYKSFEKVQKNIKYKENKHTVVMVSPLYRKIFKFFKNYSNIEGITSLIDSMSFPNHSNNDSIIKYDTYYRRNTIFRGNPP